MQTDLISALESKDVILHAHETICFDIAPDQIAPKAEIFPGCRVSGASTLIGEHCRIGTDGPAVIKNCQLGSNVAFASGYAEEATFLDGVSIGANAHIRPGTLLEEQASCAHTVGLKQTLLLPFVTLGSLINFCDCLMAGGTSRRNHSEVGSSFIHFNFTPHQDKATPSLIGDIPHGVMLQQNPIFLGGQGGLVGPLRIAYGTVLAAGNICRRDILDADQLVISRPPKPRASQRYAFDKYGDLDRIIRNNLIYIGNLHALDAWYQSFRLTMPNTTPFQHQCWLAARQRIESMTQERIKQLDKLASKVEMNQGAYESHAKLIALHPRLNDLTLPTCHSAPPPRLIEAWNTSATKTNSYIEAVQQLDSAAQAEGSRWLQSMVDHITSKWEDANHG